MTGEEIRALLVGRTIVDVVTRRDSFFGWSLMSVRLDDGTSAHLTGAEWGAVVTRRAPHNPAISAEELAGE